MGKQSEKFDIASWHQAVTDRRNSIVEAVGKAVSCAADDAFPSLVGFALEGQTMKCRMTVEIDFDFTPGKQRVDVTGRPVPPESIGRVSTREMIKNGK